MRPPQREPSRGHRLHGATRNSQQTTTSDRGEGGRLRLSSSRRTRFGAAAPPTRTSDMPVRGRPRRSRRGSDRCRNRRGARLLSDTTAHASRIGEDGPSPWTRRAASATSRRHARVTAAKWPLLCQLRSASTDTESRLSCLPLVRSRLAPGVSAGSIRRPNRTRANRPDARLRR